MAQPQEMWDGDADVAGEERRRVGVRNEIIYGNFLLRILSR